jgi:hypothetical protein
VRLAFGRDEAKRSEVLERRCRATALHKRRGSKTERRVCADDAAEARRENYFILFAHTGRGVAQPGSAPALGAGGPEFKSRRPDHFLHFF